MDGFKDRTTPSEGIHDDLYARALYVTDGTTSLAIVSCDITWISDELRRVTEAYLRERGKPVELMLCATHNHSGPTIMNLICLLNGQNKAYLRELPKRIADTIVKARETAVPATVEVGNGEVDFAFNRRILNGPVDKSFVAATFSSYEGYELARIVNYGCHGVVLGKNNRIISADFPGPLASSLEERGSVCLFLNGACGDVNPYTCKGYACLGSFEDADAMGKDIAIAVQSAKYSTPSRNVDRIEFRKLKLGLRRKRRFPPGRLDVEVCVADVFGVQVLGVEGEIFAETGIAIRESLEPNRVIIAGYTNGYKGYIPTEDAFRLRNYEASLLCWVDASAERELRRVCIQSLRNPA